MALRTKKPPDVNLSYKALFQDSDSPALSFINFILKFDSEEQKWEEGSAGSSFFSSSTPIAKEICSLLSLNVLTQSLYSQTS